MKNKIVSFALSMLCLVFALFAMTGCNLLEMFSKSDYEYDAEKVQASINRLTESGYKITVRYLTIDTETGSQPNITSSGFTIAADGDFWYCEQLDNGTRNTVYMDFSDDVEYVTYAKADGEEKWTKTTIAYDDVGSKETVKSLYINTYINVFTNYGVLAAGLKNKGTITVAGRECTKYEASASVLGASYNNEYCIDNETGLCLKNVMALGTTTDGSATTSYECTVFEVGYQIVLPAASDCLPEAQA